MAINQPSPSRGADNWDALAKILSDPRNREICALLQDHSGPLELKELASQVTNRNGECTECSEDDLHQVKVDLHHRCLPSLAEYGCLELTPTGLIFPSMSWFAKLEASLPSLDDPDAPWAELATVLARPLRTHVVSVLRQESSPITLERLVETVAAERPISAVKAHPQRDSLAHRFHHRDLPALDAAGVISYDADRKLIVSDTGLDRLGEAVDLKALRVDGS